MTQRPFARACAACAIVASIAACRSTDLLNVPVPPNVIAGGQLQDSAGAQALRGGAITLLATAFDAAAFGVPEGLVPAGLVSDEMVNYVDDPPSFQADARTLPAGARSAFDATYTDLQKARTQAQQAITVMERLHGGIPPGQIGELFAVVGYADVLLAESMCAGVMLTDVSLSGQVTYGQPLTTDSLLARALNAFDSAQAQAGGVATVSALAAVGRGRVLLDLGQYANAGAAVAGVPVAFVYGLTPPPTDEYDYGGGLGGVLSGGGAGAVDHKGQNGIGYVSLHDARLPMILLPPNFAGFATYFPAKYPLANTIDTVTLADGVEAGLIQAEAALQGANSAGWLGELNTLRAEFTTARGPYPADTSYHQLGPLADPGTDTGRVNLMFQERALWMYGTLHRLGDMRRLVRQYGRDQSTVFPVGPAPAPLNQHVAQYGTDVNFPIPTTEQANPNYKGCLSRSA